MPPVSADEYARLMASGAQEYQDVLQMSSELGHIARFTQTGGMCPAIELQLRNGRSALVTDQEEPLAWNRADHQGWAVGIYDPKSPDEAEWFGTTADNSLEALKLLMASAPLSTESRP